MSSFQVWVSYSVEWKCNFGIFFTILTLWKHTLKIRISVWKFTCLLSGYIYIYIPKVGYPPVRVTPPARSNRGGVLEVGYPPVRVPARSGYPPVRVPPWPGLMGGLPKVGYLPSEYPLPIGEPPAGPSNGTPPPPGPGRGTPPRCGQTESSTDRHVSKHNLPSYYARGR